MALLKKPYSRAYEDDDEVTTSPTEPIDDDTSEVDLTPEELKWKKRYGDLRTFNNTLTKRISSLEAQLDAAKKKDFQIPKNEEEMHEFSRQYPEVYRHIRTIAIGELLSEKENLENESKAIKEDLEVLKRERALIRIKTAHPDFDILNTQKEFHDWVKLQPKQIQDWLFESDDPALCIKALDLYKSETDFKKLFEQKKKRPSGADLEVKTKNTSPQLNTDSSGAKLWKASEIQRMHPKQFEKFEAEIELAREEGRINYNA